MNALEKLEQNVIKSLEACNNVSYTKMARLLRLGWVRPAQLISYIIWSDHFRLEQVRLGFPGIQYIHTLGYILLGIFMSG